MVTKRDRLASVLADHIPDGFQLEIRHEDDLRTMTFRYKRIADEVWCQQVMSDVIIEHAINSVESVADGILADVARKFSEVGDQT